MSLLDAAERLASLDRSQIILDAKRCLHAQDPLSECAVCFVICPVDAITVGKPPTLQVELCQSCLACLPACPVGAYRADDDVPDLLNCATHVEDQTMELVCGRHPAPETGSDSEAIGVRIRGCLAGLGSGAYLSLSTLGVQRIIARTDACDDCQWRSLRPEIQRQAERANRFLSAWDKKDAITCSDRMDAPVERALWNAKNPPLSRRDVFRMLARQGQIALARALENGVATAERKPGREYLRVASAVSHLPAASANIDLQDFGFATLSVSDSCTACGACGKACPTQALKFEKNDETLAFSLSFSAQACVGCDRCDHVCLPDAITMNHAPTFEEVFAAREPVVAASGELVHCERCKVLIARREGVTLCPLCEHRRTHPFGSLMPKKVARGARS